MSDDLPVPFHRDSEIWGAIRRGIGPDATEAQVANVARELVKITPEEYTEPPNHGILRPKADWLMIGVQRPSSQDVMLMAGNDLRYAKFERTATNITEVWGGAHGRTPTGVPVRYDCEVDASMRNITEVYAPDYPTALRLLLAKWNPEAIRRTELGNDRRAITS